ncbi:hypothetical protein [Marinoscillum furvescens]|uniref:Uncharacterized protein n=1 Tax=Marinoscillum furvescens DSM 4134 TaxID=1122208 RepID=A0A3D9KXW2_MARFU|nr:hypothetical protein [Marinoscillum furvescens]RED94072.1 hypothetical protein C7460_12213 [Marinoscillum furvescens DSM 4134]
MLTHYRQTWERLQLYPSLKHLLAPLLVLLTCFQLTAQDYPADGGQLDPVTISEERARDLMRQLTDLDAFMHSVGIENIAKDERLEAFATGFAERNQIEVFTIGYIDSDELWPRVFRNTRLKKLNNTSTDQLLAAHILFIPQDDGYTVELKLEGKTTEVYQLLDLSEEEVELIAKETSDQQLGSTVYAKPKEARETVVSAMIAALQRVEQQTDPVAQSITPVTFQPATDQKYGFDAPIHEQLAADYPTVTIGGETLRTSWKSLKQGTPDPVIAKDDAGQELTFEYNGAPLTGSSTGGTYTLQPVGGADGSTGELVAKVGEYTAGVLQTVSYAEVLTKVTIVPVNGAGAGITQSQLQARLNEIYGPAVASWQVEVMANQTLTGWDEDGNGLDDGQTGMLSNYTGEMNALIKAFRSKHQRAKDTYYVFLVAKAENTSKLGYMPRKKQWGFVFTNGQSTEALTKTIAHELGHGVYRLEHTFSEKGLPKGQTDNLMDYSRGKELYKYQWDYVHDPASVATLFDDEEDGAYTDITLFVDYLGRKDVFVHDDMFTGNDVVFLSPAGKPIQLPKTIVPSFTGSIKDQEGTTYDLGIPRGVLLAFKDGADIYSSSFSKVDGQYIFNGYKLNGSDPASFKVTAAPARTESMVVIGAEDEYCFLGIHSGYITHSNYSSEDDYQATGPVITSAISLRNQETQGWIRIDKGCTRDIELATVSPSYNDLLVNGFVIVNPADPNGVMFAYSRAVEGYEAGEATGYIYRVHNHEDGGDDYFKWTGSVWERFELSSENQLDPSSEVMRLAEIWKAIKDDPVHASLELAGFIPLLGMAADGVNAVVYYVEGDRLAAVLSSIAIVSSGVVVGVKAIVRVAKTSRSIRSTLVLSDQFSTEMEALIRGAKKSFTGNPEAWYNLQVGVLELAGKHGDAGMQPLISLSGKMESQLDFLKVANKINSFENSGDFLKGLQKEDFLEFIGSKGEAGVDAWSSFKKAGLDDLAKNMDNLDVLNKALKQDGYDAAYFENLLMSKSDPQKFLDDYVSKIGDNGKFVDNALESDYASYLTRKAREGKPPRDRADWNHTRDYMLNDSPLARGNNFNRKAWDEEWYPFWEVYLDNGKYLDGYNPITKEVVSRKATDLVDVSESTFRKYLDELIEKYAPPRVIKSQKPGYESLFDQAIPNDAKLILEIPESNRSFFDIDRYTQIASEKGITLKFVPE